MGIDAMSAMTDASVLRLQNVSQGNSSKNSIQNAGSNSLGGNAGLQFGRRRINVFTVWKALHQYK
jgi:hypothetical protein